MSIHIDDLRELAGSGGHQFCDEVADEIEQLEREHAALTAKVAELERDAHRALVALEAMQMEARARSCGLKICDDSIEELRSALRGLEAGEPVATIQGCDPYDEREGARFSLEDLMQLDKLPKGTKLYADAAPAPAGMVMVPREPTAEMITAGTSLRFDGASIIEIWTAMLTAAEGKR